MLSRAFQQNNRRATTGDQPTGALATLAATLPGGKITPAAPKDGTTAPAVKDFFQSLLGRPSVVGSSQGTSAAGSSSQPTGSELREKAQAALATMQRK